MADTEAIKRAVANLVDNAAEALQDSLIREIDISTVLVATRDVVEITVADTGHGVTRELKEKLFLPYFPPRSGARDWAWRLSVASSRSTMAPFAWRKTSQSAPGSL